jgi:hypothetical protein
MAELLSKFSGFKSYFTLSKSTILVCILFISIYRLNTVQDNETSWDVLGYYLPLPATVIHHDPGLKNIDWLKEANEGNKYTDTYYQLGVNEKGDPMYFFLFGMAIFYLPFFLLGHGSAALFGYPMDGFSEPYQFCLVIGGVVYTIIGLIFLRKILLNFYTEKISALVILIIVFATNYSHHLTIKNLETVNILFMLMTILIWFTIKWHKEHKTKQLIAIALSVALMTLVKPSEVFALFIPLFWNVSSRAGFKEKRALIWKHRKQFLIAIGLAVMIFVPQLFYWYKKTGSFIFDSYQNAGVGLDFRHPYIFEVLFSYKKGWLIYTPIMILGLIGLYLIYRKQKEIRLALLFYFLISFYVLASWTEWWYGAAFSCRPVITAYPILAIGLGALLVELKSRTLKISVAVFALLCTFMNQFQWWQLRNYVLDPVRTTKEYYWATFLSTRIPENAEEIKSVSYYYDPQRSWPLKKLYHKTKTYSMIGSKAKISSDEFSPIIFKKPFGEITEKDHVWFTVSMTLKAKDTAFLNGPFLTVTAMRKGKAYGYLAPHVKELTVAKANNGKVELYLQCLSPPNRSKSDEMNIYLWNPGKYEIEQSDFKISVYERKNQ